MTDKKQSESPLGFDRKAECERLQKIASTYNTNPEANTEQLANQYAAQRAIEYVRGPNVIVLGAATAVWADPLLTMLDQFDTVDAVANLVKNVETRYRDRVRGYVSLFEEFCPDRLYDTIVMGHILEHVVNPVSLLRRARGWLKPQGRILILVPNGDSLHRLVGVKLGLLPEPTAFTPGDIALGHRRVYQKGTLRQDVESAGFRCQHLTGLVLKPLSNSQMDQWAPALRQAFFALGDTLPDVACILLCLATQAGPPPEDPV